MTQRRSAQRPQRRASRAKAKPRAEIKADAAWLNDQTLVLVGALAPLPEGEPQGAVARAAKEELPVEVIGRSFADAGGEGTRVIIARFPEAPGQGEEVAITIDGTAVTTRGEFDSGDGGLRALVRSRLALLPADSRTEVIEFLAGQAINRDGPGDHSLSRGLHLTREALRERLPYCVVNAEDPLGFQIDDVLAIDDTFFWIKGWVRDGDLDCELFLVSPEGARAPALRDAFRYPRPDVAQFYGDRDNRQKLGFITHIEIPAPSHLPTGWIAELRGPPGVALETSAPKVLRDPEAVQEAILASLAQENPIGGPLTRSQVYPALSRLQERKRAATAIDEVQDHGSPQSSPEVTVVIPLYRRTDFLEHQLLQFSRDPDFAATELVYVLDSPELADSLATQAPQLFALYGLPFRVVVMATNAGFASANNAGASIARGRLLTLLNSDVLPDRPGWLSAMREFHDQTPDIGALGPKLLYEDDSLQHAGLYFHRRPGSAIWENAHCFKGLHRTLAAANVPRQVPAVTAACMMIDRELYHDLGGLSGQYVRGDYEDSELCLRLIQRGLRNWYLPDVELYHLEAQSYTPDLRSIASQYNMWLHTHLWGDLIGAVMDQFEPHPVRLRGNTSTVGIGSSGR